MAVLESNGEGRKPDEVPFWSVAIPKLRIYLNPWKMKRQTEVLNFVKTLDGFVGACHGGRRNGDLFLFKTENDAKGARNMLKAKGCTVGGHICEVYVEKKYLPKEYWDGETE